jgi:hypothetical protein
MNPPSPQEMYGQNVGGFNWTQTGNLQPPGGVMSWSMQNAGLAPL